MYDIKAMWNILPDIANSENLVDIRNVSVDFNCNDFRTNAFCNTLHFSRGYIYPAKVFLGGYIFE